MSSSTVRWPRVLTPSNMVQLIRQQKNPEVALQLFNRAPLLYPTTYSHTSTVYSAILDSILSSSSRHHHRHLPPILSQMIHSSSSTRDLAFSAAILSLSRAGIPDLALSLFRSIPLSNCPRWPHSFHSALQVLLSHGDLKTASQLLDEISHRVRQMPITLRSLNLLIDSLCRLGRVDLAIQLFAEIREQCCYPDRDSYRVLMRGLCDSCGNLDDAIHLLYSMLWRISQKGCEDDVIVYRTLLEALCRDGRVGDAEAVLGRVLLKGLRSPGRRRAFRKPDLRGADAEEISRRIDGVLVAGGVRSSKSYAAVILDLYGEGKFANADKMFGEMIGMGFRPTVAMFEAKIEALCREGRAEDAMTVLEREMRERDILPRVRTYELVMEGLCLEGKSQRAVECSERMERQVGCVARKETFNILVDGLLREDRYLEAASVLERMARRKYWPGVEIYDKVIGGLSSAGRRYEAVLWLEEMLSQGKIPGAHIWELLVSLVCIDHDQVELISCLEHLTGKGMENPCRVV